MAPDREGPWSSPAEVACRCVALMRARHDELPVRAACRVCLAAIGRDNRTVLLAPGAGTLPRRSGQSRDWRKSGAWTGQPLTAAARRGSCSWAISVVGPSLLF